jgi:hypothetical protein
MIHLLIDKLPSSNTKDIEWVHADNKLYHKYTQLYVTPELKQPELKQPELKQPELKQPELKQPELKVITQKPNVVMEVAEISKVPITTDKRDKRDKPTIIKPLEIILAETCTFESSVDVIKQRLIEFISTKEFSKVFGMTKSADIMSGIVNNRWNKSTALFISFLFNKSVNYNNAIVLYDREKNNGEIATAGAGAIITT